MKKIIKNIVCVPDFLRGASVFPEGFFDLVREPIRQGTNINIGYSQSSKRQHELSTGFDIAKFRERAGFTEDVFNDSQSRQALWSNTYHCLPNGAVDYLFDHLPAEHLLLSFEIPPWLSSACIERNVDFLDLRPSPLRFGRDLYIGLRSSRESLLNRTNPYCISEDELRLEAAFLGANVRMHKARLKSERGFVFENLEGALLFVGQAPYDASLIAPDGRSLRCADFADELRELSRGRQLMHKSHPFALEFALAERSALEHITGKTPKSCTQNAYQILSSEEDILLAGISSGMLQESVWFDKKAHILYKPFVPLAQPGDITSSDSYHPIHFQTLLSPAFWHQVLESDLPSPRLAALTPVAHNYARETFDHWWDYSKVITWERALNNENFMRGGGALLLNRVEALESQLAKKYL